VSGGCGERKASRCPPSSARGDAWVPATTAPRGGRPSTRTTNSQSVTADYLGKPWMGSATRGYRNSTQGGRPDESVENFAFEAWEAYIVLRLYESVRSQEIVDTHSAIEFMSTFDHGEPTITGHSRAERDIYGRDPELTRLWVLSVLEDAVNRKIENYCFPMIQGTPSSYERSWGFKSLLGAMWLQMMFLMLEDRHCWWCNKAIDPGRRSHAKFCPNDGKCKSAWHHDRKKQRSRGSRGAT
jgi:predicted nucleic acid-binding Zn ribbon protein